MYPIDRIKAWGLLGNLIRVLHTRHDRVTVVEFGAGNGSLKQYLPDKCTYVGLDTKRPIHTKAILGADVRLLTSYNDDLPGLGGCDVVVAQRLYRFKDKDSILHHLSTMVKPTGIVLLTDRNHLTETDKPIISRHFGRAKYYNLSSHPLTFWVAEQPKVRELTYAT